MSILKNLTSGLERKYVVNTILSPVTMIGEVLMETYIPFIMAKIIDIGIAQKDISYVVKTGILMVGCAILSLVCGTLGARFSAVASQGFSHNLRRKIFNKVQSYSFKNLDKFSTASLVTRLTTDVTNTQNVYQMIIRICVRSPFMLIAGSIMAFQIDSQLALLFLIAIPILAVSIIFISSKVHPRFEKMLKKFDKLNATIQENLIGIRVVKAYVRGDYEEDKFKKAADDVRKTQADAERIIIFLMPIMQIVMYFSMIAVMWFGGKKVIFGNMLSGELISFFTYVTQILTSLMMLGMIFVSIVMSQASVSRINEVLNESPDIESPKANPIMDVKDGSINFDNVSFSYNGKKDNYVLQNINLSIQNGEFIGIIGGTGSSKSTLVSLISRLYDTSEGSVKVGGVDVRNYDLQVLRDNVAMVLQKNILFTGTIKENLKWGNKNASDEEITKACKASDADSFITSFSNGYETELGQGGVNVSGGQKQRLCIARALLKNPKILIMDDSTSAVDTATETRIRNSLKEIFPQTTKIIIAQRISSVKEADKIFVLDKGSLSGFGTHDELLKNNEIYREVFESQQQGSGDADMEE